MANPAEKIKPTEYRQVSPPEVKTEEDTPAEETTKSKPGKEWALGQPAPATKYRDTATGKITDDKPIMGKVIVFKGDMVRHSTLEELKNKK